MSSPTCPLCSAPVPETVVKGPPTTVYRCAGCTKVLTWRNGQAIASASARAMAKAEGVKPATPAPAGIPEATLLEHPPPAAGPANAATALEPANAKTLAASQPPAAVTGERDFIPTAQIPIGGAELAAALAKTTPSAAGPNSPDRAITAPVPAPPPPPAAPGAPAPIKLEEDWAHTRLDPSRAAKATGAAVPQSQPSSVPPEVRAAAAEWLMTPAPKPIGAPPKKSWLPVAAIIGVILLLGGGSWAVFGRGSGTREPTPVVDNPPELPPEPPKKKPEPEPAGKKEPEPVVAKEPEPPPKQEPVAKADPPPNKELEPVAKKDPEPVAKKEPAPKTEPVKKEPAAAKKIVIESDKEADAATDGSAEVKRARAAYREGNKKLSAGDAKGAVSAYQESLRAYPGYVGAHRGMGLAYHQLKETPKALVQFRAYVKAAPGAKDAELIKKVIAKLEKE